MNWEKVFVVVVLVGCVTLGAFVLFCPLGRELSPDAVDWNMPEGCEKVRLVEMGRPPIKDVFVCAE